MSMYEIGKKYKFQMSSINDTGKNIVYTGIIIEEDSLFLKINTLFNENMILRKKDILRAKIMGGNSNDHP